MRSKIPVQEDSVSIVIVSYNTVNLLRRCLGSLDYYHEIIVVDNASTDSSADMVAEEFPHVKLIRNKVNRGFGAANNQGLEIATGQKALLLNSDAYATPGAIQTLVNAFDEETVAVGGRLGSPNGELQESAAGKLTLWCVFCEQTGLEKLFPKSKLFSPYWKSSRLPNGGTVFQVMGACLMMKRVNGEFEKFDERFFLYCEDTELCHRLNRYGKIRYEPNAYFVHELGGSSTHNRWKSVALYNLGKELYFTIHQGSITADVCWVYNRLGALLRIVLFGFFTPKARMFWKVLLAKSSNLPTVPPLSR
jgi:GT2 family glycosyltransferase